MKNMNINRRSIAALTAGIVTVAFALAAAVAPVHFAAASPVHTYGTKTAKQEAPALKQPRHFMVYYRAWRDKTMKGVNTSLPDSNWLTMHDIPYGVDVVNVFSYVPQGQENLAKPYFDALKSDYTPYLHSRGIKLVRGIDYSGIILDGFMQYVADDVNEDDYAAAAREPQTKFDQYAQKVIDEQMKPWGLDGLDIDMEDYPSSDQIAVSNKVIEALARKIGPKSQNSGSTIFLYDTNGSATDVFASVKDCFDFLAYQQYGSNSDRTQKAVSDYQAGAGLSPHKFVPGLTFPEEQDQNNRWIDTNSNYEDSNIYKVAHYVREHNLGGMFLYAFDRDGRTYGPDDLNSIKPSNLLWTKTAIAESQGMTVVQARAAASHFLDRMSLIQPVPTSVRSAIAQASNLYEVNKAVLGTDYGKGFSSTYDPTLERALMTIDTQPAFAALKEVKQILANLPASVTSGQARELKAARTALINGLTGKAYTVDSVASLQSRVEKAIDVVRSAQKPRKPVQDQKPSKPHKPVAPVQSAKSANSSHQSMKQSKVSTAVTSGHQAMPRTGVSVAVAVGIAALTLLVGGVMNIVRRHSLSSTLS